MRIARLLAAAALTAGILTPATASAAPPDADACKASVQAVATPADLGGLTPFSVVATLTAEVVCTMDVANSTVNEIAASFWGHITPKFVVNGVTPAGCGHGPDVFDGVGPVLVMVTTQTCVISFNDPNHTALVYADVAWATLRHPGYYDCCPRITIPVPIVGVGTRNI